MNILGNGNDRPSTTTKTTPSGPATQPIEVYATNIAKFDSKYQIPKISARQNEKETTATNPSTATTSQLNTHETNSNKSMVNFMSNVHSFGGNQMLSNKMHSGGGGRASSVSPKYNLNTDSNTSNFNKDIHIYKSSSSDALQHQSYSSGHHIQLPRCDIVSTLNSLSLLIDFN